jgi:hypothetical protein
VQGLETPHRVLGPYAGEPSLTKKSSGADGQFLVRSGRFGSSDVRLVGDAVWFDVPVRPLILDIRRHLVVMVCMEAAC